MSIRDLQKQAHEIAKQHGFWDGCSMSSIPEKLCLIHAEISEALEWHRTNGAWLQSAKVEGVSNFAEELADVVIRIMDLAEYCGVDLQAAIEKKSQYNLTRPRKHGKQY